MKKIFTLFILFSVIGLNNVLAQVSNEGLVGWYPFNGNANDESGNGNNGIVYGATLTADRFGNENSAYEFNDTNNNYIKLDLNQPNITEYSISAWVKTTVGGTILSGRGNCYLFGIGLTLFIYDDSTAVGYEGQIGYIADGGDSQCGKRTINTYVNNTWHHIVGVYSGSTGLMDSGEFSIYVDRILVSTNPVNLSTVIAPINQLDDLLIGSHHCWDSGFDGIIDDIRIYHRALSEQEIIDINNENFAPTILIQPLSQIVCQGETQVTFSVTSNGSAPLYYQWYKNGVTINNAIQSSYNINNVQPSDAGLYFCIVTNSFDNIPSDTATLTVLEVPVPVILGSAEVLEWSVQTYSVAQTSSSNYNFNVINGNILSIFPNYITVQWGSKGAGQVICTETNAMGCTSNPSILEVTVGALGVDKLDIDNLVISPNPSTSNINISSDVLINKFKVYNSLGMKILEKEINDFNFDIDLTFYGKGVYYFSLILDGRIVNRKVLVH
ncbi:MAG: LamG-like jellyroll fold domain-containing protein [Lentimicrobium sp.]